MCLLGLLHNDQAYTNAVQFIQTSTSLTTLTLVLVVLILDNDVRNIRMLNNVTFNCVKFSVVIIIVLTVFPLLTDIC